MPFQYKNGFKRIRPNWVLSENVFQNCEGLPSSPFGMDLVLLSYKACVCATLVSWPRSDPFPMNNWWEQRPDYPYQYAKHIIGVKWDFNSYESKNRFYHEKIVTSLHPS